MFSIRILDVEFMFQWPLAPKGTKLEVWTTLPFLDTRPKDFLEDGIWSKTVWACVMLCSIDKFRPEYNSKREESGLRVLLFFMPSERKKWKRKTNVQKRFSSGRNSGAERSINEETETNESGLSVERKTWITWMEEENTSRELEGMKGSEKEFHNLPNRHSFQTLAFNNLKMYNEWK